MFNLFWTTMLGRTALFISVFFSLLLNTAMAANTPKHHIKIIGHFDNALILELNGKQQVLRVGEKTKEGFMLLKATPKEVLFSLSGRKYRGRKGDEWGIKKQVRPKYANQKPLVKANRQIPKLVLLATFDKAVMVVINGQKQLLKPGQKSKEGVHYQGQIEGIPRFLYAGKALIYNQHVQGDVTLNTLGSAPIMATEKNRQPVTFDDISVASHHEGKRQQASFSKAKVKVPLVNNSYFIKGIINEQGSAVPMIVDTGASNFVISLQDAKRLNIPFDEKNTVNVTTASGRAIAYRTTIKKLQLGDIHLKNITAFVSFNNFPTYPLVGMSVLKRLKIEHKEGYLLLIQE